MSRSYKKTPIGGWTTAKSEKKDKTLANKKARRMYREVLDSFDIEVDESVFFDKREISNNYTWAKDGKGYFGESLKDGDTGSLKAMRK